MPIQEQDDELKYRPGRFHAKFAGRAFVFVLALLAGAGTAGCFNDDSGAQDSAELKRRLADARAYVDYEPLWAGDSLHGFALEQIAGGPAETGATLWSFYYGPCKALDDEQGSCSNPVEIQNWSICKRWPQDPGDLKKLRPFRGAQVMWRGSGGGVEIFTGRTTVVIFAPRELARETAGVLRSVGSEGPGGGLEAPDDGALRGQLPCQTTSQHPIP